MSAPPARELAKQTPLARVVAVPDRAGRAADRLQSGEVPLGRRLWLGGRAARGRARPAGEPRPPAPCSSG